MKLDFEKENDRWYVIIPDWPFGKEELEMVFGADELLDSLSTDGRRVSINVETEEPAEGKWYKFILSEHDKDGGTYVNPNNDSGVNSFWLCNVTHYVFSEHPDILYVALI